jgi:hypothetical protein
MPVKWGIAHYFVRKKKSGFVKIKKPAKNSHFHDWV